MECKSIKNEQWTIKQIINYLENNKITKPKFQRKKKWDIKKKKENNPNIKDYIEFLYDTENSVHAITFGEEPTEIDKYSNIDGNNRLNAIYDYIKKPFEIFEEFFTDLEELIDIKIDKIILDKNLNLVFTQNDKDLLKYTLKNLSYNEFVNFNYKKTFMEKNQNLYNKKFINIRDEIEDEIEKIKKNKLKLKNGDDFDANVKINVNIFKGYTTNELCSTFEKINKYSSKLTEIELLGCRLYNITDFIIEDNVIKTELENSIVDYYEKKNKLEVLDCYHFDKERDKINAYDFIVGFQNLCNKKYNFIEETNMDGLSLFFKLYKKLYKGYTFTTINVNDFIEKINYSCNIFEEINNSIFTDKINKKLFGKKCSDKLNTLKKNNMFIVVSTIISYKMNNFDKNIIINECAKALLYHFFLQDLKDTSVKETFKHHNKLFYEAGGNFIDNQINNILVNPNFTSEKITKEIFKELIDNLLKENIPHERKLDNGENKNDKRRCIKFYEKTLIHYYYKTKLPVDMIDSNEFSIEHIFPNSVEWIGLLNKDKLGNLIPIPSRINSSRQNKHISKYAIDTSGFFDFIKDIIPSVEIYDSIINHSSKKCNIIDNTKYNDLCKKNEDIYKNNFINCLFN